MAVSRLVQPAYTKLELTLILVIVAAMAAAAGYYGRKASQEVATVQPGVAASDTPLPSTTPSAQPTVSLTPKPSATPAPAPTAKAGMATYTNTAFKYAISYPDTYTAYSSAKYPYTAISATAPDVTIEPTTVGIQNAPFTIKVGAQSADLDAGYARSYVEKLTGTGTDVVGEASSATVAGKAGYKVYAAIGGNGADYYLVSHGGSIYALISSRGGTSDQTAANAAMLQSFAFTN